jgi:long-chain acyl-CoA synthetase
MISPEDLKVLTSFKVVPNAKIIDLNYTPARTFTSEEANTKIQQLARGIQDLNLTSDARIAIMSVNSYEYICIWLAIAQLGLTNVPVNIKLSPEQVAYCLEDSRAELILHTAEFRHLVPDSIKSIEIGSEQYQALHNPAPFTRPEYDETRPHYIMYTSGTTGNPKGVISTFKTRVWALYYSYIQMSDNDTGSTVAIHASPLYHLAGIQSLINSICITKSLDPTSVILPKFTAKNYIDAITEYQPTELRLVAPMMGMILQEPKLLLNAKLGSVKCIWLTSSLAPDKMMREAKYFFKNLFLIHNPYGLTETGPIFGSSHPLGVPKPFNSVGYPLKGVETRIVDGVLQVKSQALLTSYNNNKDAYQKVMTEDGFFITGDLFKKNKYGYYFYIGRSDDMFKSGGEKIYPIEIESVIDKHPAVATSAVVGVEDDVKGFKPYAFVELKSGEKVTGEQIKNYAIKNVATYQIPRQVWTVDEIPKTTIGKIDRKLLVEMAKQRIANLPQE